MKKLLPVVLILFGFISNYNAQISISAYGAVSIPTGSFSDYYNTAFGVRGNIFYATSENAQYFLHSGYNVWKFNNDKFNDWFHNSGQTGTFNLQIPNTAIPLLVGARYSVDYNRRAKIFLEAAAGVYLINSNASGKFTDNSGTYDLGTEKKNFTEFSVHIGGGTTMALSGKLRLDAGVYFDVITNSESAKQAKPKNSKEYYEGDKVMALIFCVGLNYQL
jgi:hypothetical protein